MTSHSSNDDPDAMNISPDSAPAPAIHTTTAVTTVSAARQEQAQFHESQRIAQSVPFLTTQSVQAYFTYLITKDWVPGILSPAQVQDHLQDTRNRIQRIHIIEAQRTQLLPARSSKLDETLLMAHFEYRIHFSRIFRINDLPAKILNDIFHFVVWASVDQNQCVNWHLWLTWVCRHWRELALSDPTLWNAIWFKDVPNFERSFAYFERSANAPLDIRIDDTHAKPLTLAELKYVLDGIFKKISNFRIIIIVLQEWDVILFVLHAFCAVKEKNFPMILERFEMHRSGPTYVQIGAGHEYSELNLIPLFGGATVPSLKHLSLNGIHIDWVNSVITDLANIDIRRLPLDKSPTLSQFRELIGRSPALQELFLDGAGPSPAGFVQENLVNPILIPSLRVLALGNFSLRFALYVSSHLSTPNVRDLTLLNLGGDDYSELFDAMRSTMPSVRILTFCNIDFLPDRQKRSIIKWLQYMPQVTYLRIRSVKLPILESFLYDPKTMGPPVDEKTPEQTLEEQSVPCPKLTILEVADNENIEIIIRWAQIRKQLGFPLQKVYFRARPIPYDQSQRLYAALGSGSTVHILNPGTTAVDEVNALMNEGEGFQQLETPKTSLSYR